MAGKGDLFLVTVGPGELATGSLYEGALFVLFEITVLKLRELVGVSPEQMRANHTNLE